jgi:hypothetical protein
MGIEIPKQYGPIAIEGLNNASPTSNVEGQELNFQKCRHLTVNYKIGGGTGTLQLKIQHKMSDDTWADDDDLIQPSSVASGSGKALDGYFVNYNKIRVYATVTGTLTGVTVDLSMKA